MRTEPAEPFSNGMSYEYFCEMFCYRCKKGKLNDNGFPEYVENGGCPIWDACENARFDISLFPKEVVKVIKDNGKVKHWEVCSEFESDDPEIMELYGRLFKEGE